MSNSLQLFSMSTPSMTSLDISVLVGSRHDTVKDSIKRLVNREVIHCPVTMDVPFVDESGRNRVTSAYVFKGEDGRRDSIVVVAQLSPEFTGKLVDRWQELESRNVRTLPQDYPSALRALADESEARMKAEAEVAAKTLALEAAQPAVEFAERVASAEDCHTLDEVAKMLQAGPRKFRQWLRYERFLRMDGTPYQEHMNRGLFRVIEKTIQLPHGFKIHAQVHVTGKGFQVLQRRLDCTLMGEVV